MLQAKQVLQERYYLQQSLGQNAGRQTWLAQEQSETSPKPVIVKLLAFSPQMQWDEFKLFEREAQVLKNLDHPRIPKYRDYFSLDRDTGEGLCWFALVQDYIPGNSLQQLLAQGKHFTEAQVRSIATQVLEILTYLHGLNPLVLHRDIKPSNLIWGADEQVYLVDFGAVQDPTAVEGATFTVVGTAGYAPLEQFWGRAVPASDLYALGATLIHLLTGTAPAELPQSNLRIQFRDKVSLNASFISWIEWLTEPDLDRRFSSAEQALEALKTGHSLSSSKYKSCQPTASRVQFQKSRSQLIIEIPIGRKSFNNLIKLSLKFFLALSSLFFLILPIALGILAIILVVFCVILGGLEKTTLLLIIPLIIFMFWTGNKAKSEIRVVQADLIVSWLICFGLQRLYLYKNSDCIIFEQPLPTLFFNKLSSSFDNERYSLCHLSNIKSIESIPSKGVVIQSKKQTYVFGQNLTEAECEWLVDELQEWLKSHK